MTEPINAPDRWRDHDFRLPEIARFIDVPGKTLDDWLSRSRALGFPPGVSAGRFRFYSGAHVFAVAMLAKLRHIGVGVDSATIAGAFSVAFDATGAPRIPAPGTKWEVANARGAEISVDAWLAFVAARAFAERARIREHRHG